MTTPSAMEALKRQHDFSVIEQPEGRLRLIQEDRCWISFRPTWASPISHPGRFLALLDGRDEMILMINDPQELDDKLRAQLMEELNRRYLSATVTKVHRAKTEFGTTYWDVETTRGNREFVTQSLQENAQWMGPNHLLLIDVDGNRYEIPDTTALDKVSRERLMNTV